MNEENSFKTVVDEKKNYNIKSYKERSAKAIGKVNVIKEKLLQKSDRNQ